jgi:hypothetical protein
LIFEWNLPSRWIIDEEDLAEILPELLVFTVVFQCLFVVTFDGNEKL